MQTNRPFAAKGHMTYPPPPPLKFNTGHFVNTRNGKSRKTWVELASFRSVAYIRNIKRIYMEKVTGEQALLSSTFLPYESSCHFWDLNCYHIVHSNANRPETWQFLLFPFLVFTKCQVLNLRVGLSCERPREGEPPTYKTSRTKDQNLNITNGWICQTRRVCGKLDY